MPTVEELNQHHPEYHAKYLSRLRALYEGGLKWHNHVKWWIPKNYAEDFELYESRLKRANYINHTSPMLDLMVNWLFEAPPVVSDAPNEVAEFLKNSDGHDNKLEMHLRDSFLDALIGKRAYVWINLPAREFEAQSRLEEDELGLNRPFVSTLTPEQVIDWEEDGRGGLKWVMIKDRLHVREDPPVGKRVTVFRWTYIDAERITRWEWRSREGMDVPEPNETGTLVLNVEHNIGTMPVVKLELKHGTWAMHKLHDPAVDLLRKDNDLTWALHKAAHALLVIKTNPNSVHEQDLPTVGPGYATQIDADGDMEYIEPPGRSFEVMRSAKKDAKEDLHRVVHQMAVASDSGDSARQLSGAAKARDWEALQIVMSGYSEALKDFIADIVRVVAKIADEDFDPIVSGLNAWRRRTLEQFLEAAVLAVGAQTMSATFAREVAKKQADLLLREDVEPTVLEQIHDEIDQADPFGANLAQVGKQLGDDIFTQTGARDTLSSNQQTQNQDQSNSQPAGGGGTSRAT